MTRRGASAALVAVLLVIAQVGTALAASNRGSSPGSGGSAAPIDQQLQAELKAGTATSILVEFAASADLKAPAKVKDRDQRGQAVVRNLKKTAASSQVAAITIVNGTKGATAAPYWLTNVLIVHADDAKTLDKLAKQLAKVKGVSAVRAPNTYPLVKPVETKAVILAAAGDPEWGVAKIRADEVWADGILGQGIVVANVDTGVDYLHPALVEQYRGNNGDGTFTHDYNWWDPTGVCGDEPCDNAAHGTHTMGTMVGGDGPGPFTPDTGVAPGAKWIAAKGCEDLFCTEESLLSAGQFILAPTDLTGSNPDPSLRPDIVNNSWGSGPGDPFYLETVQAWRAAGIIPVFSSGNPGPFCGEGGSPGDFLESFSAGATDDQDVIADFSGRGPSVYGKVNPDVSAPGVDVVSTVPGGEYEAFSGTSMAAPHVSGTLALMLSAKAALRGDVAAATDAVKTTALDILDDTCGGAEDGDPNNVYGEGRIDAKAAVDLVATGGTLAGTITDPASADPIAGASVTADDGERQFTATTADDGTYDLFLAEGTYQVSVQAFGYAPGALQDVVVVRDQTTDGSVALVALPRYDVTGFVRAAEDGTPIAGASVLAVGTPVAPAISDATGAYTLTLPIGTYALRGSAGGCTAPQLVEGVTLTTDDVQVNFTLGRKLDDFGHGCRPIDADWVDGDADTALYGNDWVGRLQLPFAFQFYGERYEQIFLSDNGYLNFLTPDRDNPLPVSIPDDAAPNAAIYALWRDLYLDAGSQIRYATVGAPGSRVFVLEYLDARVQGSTAPIDLEVKLHEVGETVDLLYGANPANPGDGRGATIGIENADGSDALEFSFGDGLLTANSAFRFEPAPVGTIRGTVTDGNDGEPVVGATITAAPGLVSGLTGDDGTYEIRVLPGQYQVTISKPGYVAETTALDLVEGDDVTLDAALDAAIPTVDPTELSVSLEFGADPVVETVDLGNIGSAGLTWEAREKGGRGTPAEIPAPELRIQGFGARADALTRSHGKAAAAGAAAAAGPTERRIAPHVTGAPTLIIQDLLPWDSVALQTVLEANGAAYDVITSDLIASTDLGAYDRVMLSNDQPQAFYDAYVANTARFDDYVNGGGFLWVEAAYMGFGDGSFEGAVLPGGVTVGPVVYDDFNDVQLPDHPIMAGVPDPVSGSSASHSVFTDVPVDAAVITTSSTTGEPTLLEWDFGAGHVLATSQTLEFGFDNGQDAGLILENAVPYALDFFTDVSWLSEAPESGSLAIGASQQVAITIGDPTLVPGEYDGKVVFVTDAPKPRSVTVDVRLSIALPESWGGLTGTVTDAHTDEPLPGVTVTLRSRWNGQPYDVTATTDGDGVWRLIGPSGDWPLESALAGYVGDTRTETVEAGTTREGIDASLHRDQAHATIEGGPLTFILTEGQQAAGTISIGNPGGHRDLEVTTGEVDLGGPSAEAAGPSATPARAVPAGVDANARTTRGWGTKATAVPPRLAADGDVLASWPAGMTVPWGVAVQSDGDVWLSDPEDLIDVRFTAAGDRQGQFDLDWVGVWGGDMAFDPERNLIWQVNVGGDNGIYGLDPSDGSVVETITGSPWDSISQRGLAYDPDADVFYIGGWNEGVIYRVAGPSSSTPGETLSQCDSPAPEISGLAWNRSFGLLWVSTNSETDDIWLVDPATCEPLRAIPHPDGGGFQGAGLELDAVGNLWTTGQGSGNAYLIESGLPTFSDVPWLTVDPTEATVAPDGSVDLHVSVDTTGLLPGVHRAIVVVQTNDPDHPTTQVPVTVSVPAYQLGINAGGGAFVASDGTPYLADRAYRTGPYGWQGSSSTRSTTKEIDGTDDDALYQDQRLDMRAYRFDVPEGTYRVDLRFAELQKTKAGQRRFDVLIEGEVVLYRLDVVEEVGANRTALDKTFYVTVTDGYLDISFFGRGEKSMVNAILVTEIPEGTPVS